MAKSRFLDDTQIISTNNQNATNQIEENEIIPQPINETVNPIKEPIKNNTVNQTIVKTDLNKKQAYLDIIKQFESSLLLPQEIKEEVKENKPVYNFNRDTNGKVNIQSKDIQLDEVKIDKPKIVLKNIVADLLEKSEQEVNRLELEIQIHIILLNEEIDQAKRSIYQTRLSSFQSDLEYNKKRKSILEKML